MSMRGIKSGIFLLSQLCTSPFRMLDQHDLGSESPLSRWEKECVEIDIKCEGLMLMCCSDFHAICPADLSKAVTLQQSVSLCSHRYAGFITRQEKQLGQMQAKAGRTIPDDMDYQVRLSAYLGG